MKKSKKLIRILKDAEIEQIHQKSLHLLKRVGIKVEDEEIRERLQDSGCQVEGERVKLNPELVAKVIDHRRDNNQINFCSWNGITEEVEKGKVISHSFGTVPEIIDYQTGEKRKAYLSDLKSVILLMDRLEYVDMPTAMLYPADIPPQLSQIKMTEYLLRYSSKPVSGPGGGSPEETRYILELFKAFKGGRDKLGENPIGTIHVSPESPLYYPQPILDTMKLIIKTGIPTKMLICPITGISAPMTITGGLTQMNASMLAFCVISYLINPDTPVVYGSRLAFANMKTGHSIWGLPEVGIAGVCAVQLADYYGLPSDVYGLSTTSCAFDNQSGYEKAVNGLLPILAGSNFVSGLGGIASGTVASYEQLVIDNETYSVLLKVAQGVDLTEESIGLDVIFDVIMNGGNYLAQEHTVKYLRDGEIFIPQVGFDGLWQEWEAEGKKTIRDKAREVIETELDAAEETMLADEVDQEVERIVASAQQELVTG